MNVRELSQEDIPAAVELINADQMPSQPTCSVQDLQNALAGRATIDRGWWEALVDIRTIVATTDDEIVGVASYGTRKDDGSGFILWLHACEVREVTEALVVSMLSSLQNCPRVYAFWIATPLTLGVEGLPVAHRPVMHQVLLDQQFIGKDCWLYMAGPVLSYADMVAEVEQTENGWKLFVQAGGEQGCRMVRK